MGTQKNHENNFNIKQQLTHTYRVHLGPPLYIIILIHLSLSIFNKPAVELSWILFGFSIILLASSFPS